MPPFSATKNMSAIISACGQYRYRLERELGPGKTCLFIMFNPSTADAANNDPTVRRCIGFARTWGYGKLMVGNLFAFRTPYPDDLMLEPKPHGPRNLVHLKKMCDEADFHVIAWGTRGRYLDQNKAVLAKLEEWKIPVHFLKLTKEGHPQHPLYVKKTLVPARWSTE